MSATIKYDEALRQKLLELRAGPNKGDYSNSKLANKLAVNSSYVSQYCKTVNADGTAAEFAFNGDLDAFERKLMDFLANDARRKASGVDTTECDETEQVRIGCEYIRKTTDIGVILDPSGGGKSRGLEHYAKKNPTAILYKTFSWNNTKNDCSNFMFTLSGRDGYDNRTNRTTWALKKLTGSDRLIIVDDAHFLHHTALLWWVHFHEATQMPLALAGTFELLKKIEADPQIFSRVGLRFEINKRKDGKLVVDRRLLKHLVEQLLPCNGEQNDLLDLCEQVAMQHGQYRSVHKQLKVAAEIKAGNGRLGYCDAFRAAHTMLVRNYNLN